ncbi:hypothetical protein PGT21_024077 [Puccinia graminis f. sp. tritici]|uniref:Uncharacterized protein n=1 Tax=Puccinia graminis f. sp. tritici TaxID=56615 RepID=A0A5B0MLE3_PUCGR|nr:hypothetical protein PGT21_024077 [Puccinia graminis f. sp. tritici]
MYDCISAPGVGWNSLEGLLLVCRLPSFDSSPEPEQHYHHQLNQQTKPNFSTRN